MSLEITRRFVDGDYELENHITVENGKYKHRQIEKVDGKVFMRFKTRTLIEQIPNI